MKKTLDEYMEEELEKSPIVKAIYKECKERVGIEEQEEVDLTEAVERHNKMLFKGTPFEKEQELKDVIYNEIVKGIDKANEKLTLFGYYAHYPGIVKINPSENKRGDK